VLSFTDPAFRRAGALALRPAWAGRTPLWALPAIPIAALVAALLPHTLGFGLAILAIGGLLALRNPAWGVYALVLSVPAQREILIAGRGTATQATMAGLVFLWWAWTAARGRPIRLPGFAVALAAYIVVMVLSLAVATSLSAGLAEIARWSVALLAFLIVVNVIRTRAEILGLLVCFVAGAAAEGALGVWQVITRQVPPSFFVGQGGDPEDLAPRAFGTIGAPNSYAGYLNLTLALAIALSLWLAGRSLRRAWAARGTGAAGPLFGLLFAGAVAALTAVTLAGLVLSFSRGGLIGLAFGLVAMAVALGRRAAPTLIAGVVGVVALAGLMVAGALPTALSERISSTIEQLQIYDVRGVAATPSTFNQIERLAHWQTAGNMYLSDPWLGVGIGNFNVTFYQFSIPGWPISRGHAHNYFLHALAETGLAGLLAYLVVLGTALAAGVRALRAARRARAGFETTLIIGAIGVLFTIIGHSVFEDLHVLNMSIHWVAVIALFYLVPPLLAPRAARGGLSA
jgi:O-antigen ligase